MKESILGNISSKQFLQEYWQKKPLLIRQAFPKFRNIVKKDTLFSLSYREEMQSRLIMFKRNKWHLLEGPFGKSHFGKIQGIWTLLVQGINHVIPEVYDLLNKFNFIPYARLDDIMISYATPNGGVGPHVDSYDVFLLQGLGRRLWQISNQKDQTLLNNTPLKILKHFDMTHEWILEPGDMLYLPPNYAHNGIALDECMTYSIGFRAPSYQEIVMQFLGYMQENYHIDGMYTDPTLKATNQPACIPAEMNQHIYDVIQRVHFTKQDTENFLGKFLTEPKPHIIFDAPEMITLSYFSKKIKKCQIVLDPKTQMLFNKNTVFINGESYHTTEEVLRQLANERQILPIKYAPTNVIELLYHCYLDGYLTIKD